MNVYSKFYDHEVVSKTPDDYVDMTISVSSLIKAWSSSLFAHELLDNNGKIKPITDLTDTTLEKYMHADAQFKRDEPVAKPVIGVGLMNGIEIGIGKEIIAAANTHGFENVIVSVRKAQADEIQLLLPK